VTQQQRHVSKSRSLKDNCPPSLFSWFSSQPKSETPPKAKHPPSTVKSNKKQQKVTKNHQFTFHKAETSVADKEQKSKR
jgi:hypothetical protein